MRSHQQQGPGQGQWGRFPQEGDSDQQRQWGGGQQDQESQWTQAGRGNYPQQGGEGFQEFGQAGYGPGGYGGYGREEGGFGQQGGSHQGFGRPQQGQQSGRGEWGAGSGQGSGQGGYGQQGYGQQFGSGRGYGQGQGFGGQGYGQGSGGQFGGYGQSHEFGAPLGGQFGREQSGQAGQSGQSQYGYGQGSAARRARKGPKDFVRSDERIREAVCERLSEEESIDVSEVSVEVKDGCVTLQGTVPERHMKHVIEDIADNCWGVNDVENHVRVQSAGSEGRKSSASAQAQSAGKGRGKEETSH